MMTLVDLLKDAATRLEGLRNTVVDDAALREILAEEYAKDGRTVGYVPVRDAAALRAMSRVSRLEGLRDGVTVPEGWVLVPKVPTPEMLAKTLPMATAAMGMDMADWRLVETALAQIESPAISNSDHGLGVQAGLEVLRDYRAMLAAAPAALNPDIETLEALEAGVATTEKP